MIFILLRSWISLGFYSCTRGWETRAELTDQLVWAVFFQEFCTCHDPHGQLVCTICISLVLVWMILLQQLPLGLDHLGFAHREAQKNMKKSSWFPQPSGFPVGICANMCKSSTPGYVSCIELLGKLEETTPLLEMLHSTPAFWWTENLEVFDQFVVPELRKLIHAGWFSKSWTLDS